MMYLDLIVKTKKLSILILFSFLIFLSFFGHLGQGQAIHSDGKLNATVITDRPQIAPNESLILYVQVTNIGKIDVTNISVTLGLPEGFESSPNDTIIRLNDLIPNETNFKFFSIKALSNVTPNDYTIMAVVNSTNASIIEVSKPITVVSIIRLILLNTSIVAILFSIFIIFASNRDIEGWHILEEKIEKKKKREKWEKAFFRGIYKLLIYSICVVALTTIIVLFIENIYSNTEIYIFYLYILLSLILLFTTIFTILMAGYVRPLLLGCISGIVLFLVFVSWRFSVSDISLGGFMIPIYVPASSFLGALCSMFVHLYYHPSKLHIKDDKKRVREYTARIFASIILGLFVYAAALPDDNGPRLPIFVFVLFGFASGFYISPMISYLRKRIFSRIDEAGLKEDDRKIIIEDIEENPDKYSILSEGEIKHIANQNGMDEKKLTKLIKEKDIEGERRRIIEDIEENPDKYSILSHNEIQHIADQTGMDEKELTKLIIERDIKCHPDKYSILSDDKIKHIANKTGMDEEELTKLIRKCLPVEGEAESESAPIGI